MDAFASALDIAAAIKAKEVSPLEVADVYLARIDKLERDLNTFAHQDPDRVRRAALDATDAVAGADDTAKLPPFHGVPMPIKNLNPVAGWPCTYGSRGASSGAARIGPPVTVRRLCVGSRVR